MNGKTVRSSDHGVLFYNVFAASPILPPPPSKKKKKSAKNVLLQVSKEEVYIQLQRLIVEQNLKAFLKD